MNIAAARHLLSSCALRGETAGTDIADSRTAHTEKQWPVAAASNEPGITSQSDLHENSPSLVDVKVNRTYLQLCLVSSVSVTKPLLFSFRRSQMLPVETPHWFGVEAAPLTSQQPGDTAGKPSSPG